MDSGDDFLQKAIFKAYLELKRPYFGAHLYSSQGDPGRHMYMQGIVETQSQRRQGQPLRILEVGSWAGGSAITWAGALKRFHNGRGNVLCVDTWRPYFIPTEVSHDGTLDYVYQGIYDAAQSGEILELFLHNIKYSGHEDVIVPIRGASDTVLPYFADRSFDIVFVDGAHVYDSAIKDLRSCARLVDIGGIICGDDLEVQLSEADPENIERCKNKDYVEDPRTKAWHHPGITKAVGEFFGPVDCWRGIWAVLKTPEGWGRVDFPPPERYGIPAHLESAELQFAGLMLTYARKRKWL